jgi:hypothetical protein
MSGFGRRFDPGELLDDPSAGQDAELLGTASVARELEAIAERDATVSADFTDRVMGAIAAEPTPQPTLVFGLALRAGRIRDSVRAVGDAWRVAFGAGRPLAVRGQALALALVVLVGAVGLGGGAAIGAAGLLAPDGTPEPSPSQVVPSPSPSPSVDPSPSALPTETPEATETPEPTETAEPSETPDDGLDDSSGPGSGDGTGGNSSGSGSDDSTPVPN